MAIHHIPDGGDFQFDSSFGFSGSANHDSRASGAPRAGAPPPTPYRRGGAHRASGKQEHDGDRHGAPTLHPHGHHVVGAEHLADGSVVHHHAHGGFTVHHHDGGISHHAKGGEAAFADGGGVSNVFPPALMAPPDASPPAGAAQMPAAAAAPAGYRRGGSHHEPRHYAEGGMTIRPEPAADPRIPGGPAPVIPSERPAGAPVPHGSPTGALNGQQAGLDAMRRATVTMPISDLSMAARGIAKLGEMSGARQAVSHLANIARAAPQVSLHVPAAVNSPAATPMPAPEPGAIPGAAHGGHARVRGRDWNPGGRKGKLHRELGVPEDQTIPAGRLAQATRSRDPEVRRDAIRAETMKKWHKNPG